MELEYARASGPTNLARGVHFSSVPNVFGLGKGVEVIYILWVSHGTRDYRHVLCLYLPSHCQLSPKWPVSV